MTLARDGDLSWGPPRTCFTACLGNRRMTAFQNLRATGSWPLTCEATVLFAPQPRQGGSDTKCTTHTRAHMPSKRRAHQTQSQKVSGGPTSSASSSDCSAGLGTGSRPAARALHTGAHDVIRLKSRPNSAAREAGGEHKLDTVRHVSRPINKSGRVSHRAASVRQRD